MAGRKASKTDNIVDPALKKTFIEMRDHFQTLNDRANGAAAKRRQYLKEVKEAGYSLQQIKISLLLQTPEGEAEFKAEMANRLLAAAYSDADIGEQLSLFLDGDRTPAVDRAYKEGQTRAMENKTLETTKYSPGTDQYNAFCDGYHAEQERQVKAGIGKLDAKAGNGKAPGKAGKPAKAGKAAAAAKPAGKRGRPPGGGKKADKTPPRHAMTEQGGPPRKPAAAPVTRASLAAAKADAPADSYFSKSAETKGNA